MSWLDVAAIVLGWLFTISGVALGGFLVFKTKYVDESLWGRKKEARGGAFVVDEVGGEGVDFMPDDRVVDGTDEGRAALERNSRRFMAQYAQGRRGMTHHLDPTETMPHPEQVAAMARAQAAEAPRPDEGAEKVRGDAFNLEEEGK